MARIKPTESLQQKPFMPEAHGVNAALKCPSYLSLGSSLGEPKYDVRPTHILGR
jgi:hypothetical protein